MPEMDAPKVDPLIQAAQSEATATPDAAMALDPLQKDKDALLIADPNSPYHALYEQALKGLELMGTRQFKDRRELERVALSIAMQAAAVGVARIDRVVRSEDGASWFFADEQAIDPAMRGHLQHAEALRPLTPQRIAEAQQMIAQRQQHQQLHQDQTRRDVERDNRLVRDPPSRQL